MTDETIDGWLCEQAKYADNARHQSHQCAPNSYGAGYDQGRYDGFREVLAKLADLWSDAAVSSPGESK